MAQQAGVPGGPWLGVVNAEWLQECRFYVGLMSLREESATFREEASPFHERAVTFREQATPLREETATFHTESVSLNL